MRWGVLPGFSTSCTSGGSTAIAWEISEAPFDDPDAVMPPSLMHPQSVPQRGRHARPPIRAQYKGALSMRQEGRAYWVENRCLARFGGALDGSGQPGYHQGANAAAGRE